MSVETKPAITYTQRSLGIACPFCGRNDTLEFAHNGRFLAVECALGKGGCGARGPQTVRHGEAVAMWNKRSPVEMIVPKSDKEQTLANVLIDFLRDWQAS